MDPQKKLNLRVKGPINTHTFHGLDSSLTMAELQSMIAKECQVPVDDQICKCMLFQFVLNF